jgi:hypothetical protein
MKNAQRMNATMSKDTSSTSKKTPIWLNSFKHMNNRLSQYLMLMLKMMVCIWAFACARPCAHGRFQHAGHGQLFRQCTHTHSLSRAPVGAHPALCATSAQPLRPPLSCAGADTWADLEAARRPGLGPIPGLRASRGPDPSQWRFKRPVTPSR